jgi:hypothetical protein
MGLSISQIVAWIGRGRFGHHDVEASGFDTFHHGFF